MRGELLALLAVGALAAGSRGSRNAITPSTRLTKKLFEVLAEEVKEAEGFYGSGGGNFSGGEEGHFTLNIKAHPSIPDWVEVHIGGYEALGEREGEIFRDTLEFYVEGFLDKDSSLYQAWFDEACGSWTTAGRGGGYLLLSHGGLTQELEEILDWWDDETCVRITIGGRRLDPVSEKHAREVAMRARRALDGFTKLEGMRREHVRYFEKDLESDAYWAETLDVEPGVIAKIKATLEQERQQRQQQRQQQLQSRRR